MFRVYEARYFINDTWFGEIWIDSHYELKHKQSINDELILELVQHLTHQTHFPQEIRNGYQFYESEIIWREKLYRLIWLIPPDESYLGVRNAYRRPR